MSDLKSKPASTKPAPAKPAPAKPASTKAAPAKPDPKLPAEPEVPRSRLSWVVGWVLVPGSIIGVLFGGGVLVGAHFHDSWFVRSIVWIVELFT